MTKGLVINTCRRPLKMVTTVYERELGFGSIGLVETSPDLPFIQFPAVGVRGRGLDLVKN